MYAVLVICQHVTTKCFALSRKLAVASWSYSCFSKGRGRPEFNTVIFHSNPPPRPQTPGAFRGGVGSRWSRAQIRQVSRQSVARPNPLKIPSCFQAHVNLSFRSPRLGPQVHFLFASMIYWIGKSYRPPWGLRANFFLGVGHQETATPGQVGNGAREAAGGFAGG